MFEYDGVKYKLQFTEGVIEAIEMVIDHSIMAELYQNKAMLSLKTLKTMFIMGLIEVDTGKRPGQNKGQVIYDSISKQLGYSELVGYVVTAFEHDCPFFFQMN